MKSSSLVGQLLRWQVMATVGTWAVLAVLLMFVLTRHEAGDLDQRMRYFARLLAESCAAESSVPAMAHRAQVVEDIFFEGLIRFLDREPTRRTLYQILGLPRRVHVSGPVYQMHYQAVREKLGVIQPGYARWHAGYFRRILESVEWRSRATRHP